MGVNLFGISGVGRAVIESMENRNEVGYLEMDPSGRYGRFGEILGRGATKTVYRGFDEVLGMEVAWIQVIVNDTFSSPEDITRLCREVDLLKKLNHECILRFYTSWIDNNGTTFNLITEMFSSGTLRSYRKKYKRVEIEAIKRWARQILKGLVYLHSRDPPVIHRDIKCDNIFVNGHLGQVKIGDLGLAAILHGSQPARSILGTPEFMAPELYEEEYNELVDVYSFGMCVLEMLTSEYPYSECFNSAQIYKKVISGKKPNVYYRIQDIKAQQFIAKCLEVAEKRLTAKELLLDPFLGTDESLLPDSVPPLQIYSKRSGEAQPGPSLSLFHQPIPTKGITFSGELKPDANTIFLQLNITDSDGHVRKVQFPFDIVDDNAMEVATEMVNELDIADWEPLEIATMMESELSLIFPTWKDYNLATPNHTNQEKEAKVNVDNNKKEIEHASNKDDEKITNDLLDSTGKRLIVDERSSSSQAVGSSRFYYADENAHEITDEQEGNSSSGALTLFKETEKPKVEKKTGKLRSFNDITRKMMQKLALKQGWQKRRSSKTVGSVDAIGFQHPDKI